MSGYTVNVPEAGRVANRILSHIEHAPLWVLPLMISVLLFFPVNEVHLTTDGEKYMSYALNIYKGYGFLGPDWSPIYFRPVFPVLIAVSFWLFGVSPSSAFLACRFFFLPMTLLMYSLGEKLCGKWVGLVTALLVLSSVSLNQWAVRIHLDYITPFFMLLFVLLTYLGLDQRRYRWFALAGIALGLGYLVKEVTLLFAPLPVMALVLIRAFRCHKNLSGVLLLIGTLALIVLPWFGYTYFGAGNLEQSAITKSVTLVGARLSVYDANVESLTVWRYMRAFIDYYKLYLKPNVGLAPLMVVAWGFTLVTAAIKRDKAYLFISCAALLLVVIIVFQGTAGYRVTQGIVVFLLSYLVLANFVVKVGKTVQHKLSGCLKGLGRNQIATGTGIFLICVPLVFQAWLEEVDTKTMQGFTENYNTIQFLSQKDKSWVIQQVGIRQRHENARQAVEWLRKHAPPGSVILSEPRFLPEGYIHSQGEFPFHRLYFPDVEWYLWQEELGKRPVILGPDNPPSLLFLWVADTPDALTRPAYFLTEEYLLNEVEEKFVDYVIVTDIEGFLALYFFDNPGFRKVADFGNSAIQIFRVEDVRPSPFPFETHVDINEVAFLQEIRQRNPERYQLIEAFFRNVFGWGPDEIQKTLDGGYPKLKLKGSVGLDHYVKLCQSRGPHGITRAIGQYQRAVELDPGNAWSYTILGALHMAQGNTQDALTNYRQAVLLSPDPTIIEHISQKLDIASAYLAAYLSQGESYRARHAVSLEDSIWITYDFIDHLDLANVFAGNPSHVRRSAFVINQQPRGVLFQHPSSQISYLLNVPVSALLDFSLALAPETWQLGKGDGVQFDIYIRAGDGSPRQNIFSRYIDPKNIPADRRWHDYEVDLSPWARQTVILTFATGPGPNGDNRYDWAGWGEPRIVQLIAYSFLPELPDADHGGADERQVRQDTLTVGYELRPILLQHPFNRVTYRVVNIPKRGWLYFGLGMDPAVWSPDKGDGVEYSIYVRKPKEPYKLYQVFYRYVDPKHNPDDRRWLDQVVDLSAYGGQMVDIIFEASSGPASDANFDWGGWSTPVLLADSTVLQNPASQELAEGRMGE